MGKGRAGSFRKSFLLALINANLDKEKLEFLLAEI